MTLSDSFSSALRLPTDYSTADAKSDLLAGLTVGVMLIPQGMAYALVAGLPPIYGLYAALVPLLAYAALGTSRHLATGPTAMVALLVAAGVAPLAGGDVGQYVMLAALLALLVGLIQLTMGLARMGFITNFLSHPVLGGFTAAAGVIIGLSQVKHILGIEVARSSYLHQTVASIWNGLGATHGVTLAIAAGSAALLVGLKRWRPALPGSLVVVVLGTGVTWLFGLHNLGVRIVGEVPMGLPEFATPSFNMDTINTLFPAALAIALVSFMESIANAKTYAARNRYEIDPNQELVSLGLSNVGGAFFQAFPIGGSFSRTAVNAGAGARSKLAGVVSAAIIGLTLLLLTPLFQYMPMAVLAAIVLVAVVKLIDVREARILWRIRREDCVMMLLTFVATLFLGVEVGIVAGVVVSLLLLLHQSSRPNVATMGRLPNSNTFRNVERHPTALTRSDVIVVRMDASLYFGNATFLKDQLTSIAVRNDHIESLVFDAYSVNRIDATAAFALRDAIETCHLRGFEFYFAGVKGRVKDVLDEAGVVNQVGDDHFFHEVHEAVDRVTNGEARLPTPFPTGDGAPAPPPSMRQTYGI